MQAGEYEAFRRIVAYWRSRPRMSRKRSASTADRLRGGCSEEDLLTLVLRDAMHVASRGHFAGMGLSGRHTAAASSMRPRWASRASRPSPIMRATAEPPVAHGVAPVQRRLAGEAGRHPEHPASHQDRLLRLVFCTGRNSQDGKVCHRLVHP